MHARKPILQRYQFRWYPTLKQAAKACDHLNSTRDDLKEDPLYLWRREYTLDRNRDFIVEEP